MNFKEGAQKKLYCENVRVTTIKSFQVLFVKTLCLRLMRYEGRCDAQSQMPQTNEIKFMCEDFRSSKFIEIYVLPIKHAQAT